MNIYSLIIILELLSINTYTTYTCSKKKKSKFNTLFSVCIVTAAISVLLLLIVPKIINYSGENGNGVFLLCGFLYVIPLKCLFDQPIKHMIIIMSSSWIYTMFVFTFSFWVGHLFPLKFFWLSVVIIQTFGFAMTLPPYIKFVNKIFVYILRNIENKMINSLLVISLSWFFIIFLLNYTFAEGRSLVLEFIMLFVIISNAVLSYTLLYSLVSVNNKAKELSQITQIDTLTQLRNRESFYKDVLNKIDNNKCFTIIFVDLDDFKSVNDTLGHAAGDAYLINFVKASKELLNPGDGFYRLHGDEFVFLMDRIGVENFCRKIENLKFCSNSDGLHFKGISIGCSSFPADGNNINELLHLADFRMYQIKKERHRI